MSASAMNTSLKNNRNLLSKRDRLTHTLGDYNSENKTQYNLPKASSKQLSAIKKRMLRERKIRRFKVIVLTGILFLALLVFVLTYFKNASYYLQY